MHLNTKIIATTGLLAGVVLLASMTSIQQQQPPPQQQERKFTNLKVLPKHITERQLDNIMNTWRRSLGVQCTFCHARDNATNKTDFASDVKPEKLTARKMLAMAAKINSKYFDAKKDSLGMMTESSVSCNTCHRGEAHPQVALAAQPPRGGQGGQFGGPGGQQRPPGGQGGAPGGQGAPGGGQGQGGQGQRPPANTTPPPPGQRIR